MPMACETSLASATEFYIFLLTNILNPLHRSLPQLLTKNPVIIDANVSDSMPMHKLSGHDLSDPGRGTGFDRTAIHDQSIHPIDLPQYFIGSIPCPSASVKRHSFCELLSRISHFFYIRFFPQSAHPCNVYEEHRRCSSQKFVLRSFGTANHGNT